MKWNEVKEVTLDEVKILNPEFDFRGWKLTKGEIFKEYKNYCLTSNKEGLYLIVWLDRHGTIIPKSLNYAGLLLKNKIDIKNLANQIKNEMCKPLDKTKQWFQVYDIWNARIKSIKEKEKGLKRLLLKEDKLYNENGCYKFNKINGLVELRWCK